MVERRVAQLQAFYEQMRREAKGLDTKQYHGIRRAVNARKAAGLPTGVSDLPWPNEVIPQFTASRLVRAMVKLNRVRPETVERLEAVA